MQRHRKKKERIKSCVGTNKKTEWTPTWWSMAKRWTRDRSCLESKSVKQELQFYSKKLKTIGGS